MTKYGGGPAGPQPGVETGQEPIWGIRGTGIEARAATEDTLVFYVNHAHAAASDDNYGTDMNAPLQHIQELIDRETGTSATEPELQDGSIIYVSGDVAESIVTPTVGTMPTDIHLIGVGSRFRPTWSSGAAASPCLDLRTTGWTIDGFEFECPASSAGIILRDTIPVASDSAYKTTIQNCTFDGLWGGLYGIDFSGAPHRVCIYNNWFVEMHQAANDAACIFVSATPNASAYQCEIIGNRFMDSDNYVMGNAAGVGFNVSLFKDNVFEEGVLLIPALYLDLRGGTRGYNIVTGNFFGGAYTNVGGYFANPATPNSCWIGNTTDPTPGTVADNGLTVAVPA